jgi:hypothetical protein
VETKGDMINAGKSELEDVIIIVSGLPRSGTSMMMAMLEAGGVPLLTDGERVPDDDNPKGYFEFERVKKLQEGDVSWLSEAQGKAVKIISYLLFKLPDTHQYQVIFIHRNLDEILSSQKKMLLNRGEDPNKVSEAELKTVLSNHLTQVEEWLGNQPNIRSLEVDYNRILEDPGVDIQRMVEFLDFSLDPEGLKKVVDHKLYRQRH